MEILPGTELVPDVTEGKAHSICGSYSHLAVLVLGEPVKILPGLRLV
jgi:hypothetical protein